MVKLMKKPQLTFTFSGHSETGRRQENQDAYMFDPDMHAACVTDGIGSFKDSKLAAYATQLEVMRALHQCHTLRGWKLPCYRPYFNYKNHLLSKIGRYATETAHERVRHCINRDENQIDGACTLAMVLMDGDHFSVVNVGDSRVYLFRDFKLEQLTVDHNWAQNAIVKGVAPALAMLHPKAKALTQALGAGTIRPSITEGQLKPGDRLLVCTDGLDDVLGKAELAKLLHKQHMTAETLVKLAYTHGSTDNITAILIQVEAVKEEQTLWQKMTQWFGGNLTYSM